MAQHNPKGRNGGDKRRIAVIIPALNEELAIAKVIREIPGFIDQIIVADNGSTDQTAAIAQREGATVVPAPERGYGHACMAGVEAAPRADIFVFLDGDGSDYPHEMLALLQPILSGEASMVIGSRARGESQTGSMTLPQRFGNKLACTLMRWFWKSKFTDLGPFRAIDRAAYERLNMSAPTFGWTVQMQVRALKYGVKSTEIPVSYRQRLGVSKISGTVKGVILAGFYILGTIFWETVFNKAPRTSLASK